MIHPRRLKHMASAGVALACVLVFPMTALASSLVQEGGPEHGAEGDPMAIGLSWSVLFMMTAPYVLLGLAGAALWRSRSPQSYERILLRLRSGRVSSFLRRRWIYLAPILIAAVALFYLVAQQVQAGQDENAAIQTLKQYVQAIYPRDYSSAYPLISMADRHVKSEPDYLRESNPLTGFSLEIARKLASHIEYKNLQVEMRGNRATIHVTLVGPDTDTPALNDILFAESATNAPLSEAQKQALSKKLDALIDQAKLPTFDSEQEFTLVRELGQWRMFLGWGNGVTVKLFGKVAAGLPWEFGPAQPVILAQPGKTYRAVYRARNLTNQRITGKATRRTEPKDKTRYLHTLQCFCMIQETLQPSEVQEMQLVFTLDPDIPPDVHEFDVSYVFYPIEKFPANGTMQ